MSDFRQQLEDLMEKIPGYKGYAQREYRRDADRELRQAIAEAFSSQVERLSRVQDRLLSQGDFATMEVLDKVITRLQHLSDRLHTATYGYTGFFDRVKQFDDAELRRLYEFDLQLAKGVEKLGDLIAQFGLGAQARERAHALLNTIDQLHHIFDQRSRLVETLGEGAEEETNDTQPPHHPTPSDEA